MLVELTMFMSITVHQTSLDRACQRFNHICPSNLLTAGVTDLPASERQSLSPPWEFTPAPPEGRASFSEVIAPLSQK